MTTPLPSGRRAARDSASERKALWEAAHGGRLDDVRRCLDAGVSVDAVYQGSTPLWYAAYYGHAEVVRLLLERGANPKARNRAGRKARDVICGGCYGRDRAVLRAEVEDIFPFEEARPGEAEAVEAARVARGHYNTEPNQIALWSAARSGGEAEVRGLLAKGVEVDCESALGATPLWWAAHNGHASTARALLDGGADATRAPRFGEMAGRLPLTVACAGRTADARGRAALEDMLSPTRRADIEESAAEARLRQLSSACRVGDADAARALLARSDADVDARDLCGHTPLWYASKYGHPALVEMLLAAGADRELGKPLAVMCSGYCADSVEGKEEKASVARRIEAMLDPAGCERRLKKGRRWETARGAGKLRTHAFEDLAMKKLADVRLVREYALDATGD